MLSHIKDLFRQRKERQQKNFFSRNNKQPTTTTPSTSTDDMKVRTYPAKENALPVKTVFQPARVVEPTIRKKRSSDDMTVTDENAMDQDDNKSTVAAADELANLLVKQDNKRRSQLPSYPGLERFEIIRKLGEYVCYLFV